MITLLEQFVTETRDALQDIGDMLMALESAPEDPERMHELFRLVHTLKGNSGLFDFPEMTRVLHAGEDLMDAVRHGYVKYSTELADRLLDTMDFVGLLCDAVDVGTAIDARFAADSARLTAALRHLTAQTGAPERAAADNGGPTPTVDAATVAAAALAAPPLMGIPEAVRMAAYRQCAPDASLHWLTYVPEEACFFQGDDPFYQARRTPGLQWGGISARQQWPSLAQLDAYRCVLDFQMLSSASEADLLEYFRYMPDQVTIVAVPPLWLVLPQGLPGATGEGQDFLMDALDHLHVADLVSLGELARDRLENTDPGAWLASVLRWLLLMLEVDPNNGAALAAMIESLHDFVPPAWSELATGKHAGNAGIAGNAAHDDTGVARVDHEQIRALAAVMAVQRQILRLPIETDSHLGRTRAVVSVLRSCLKYRQSGGPSASLDTATEAALASADAGALVSWIDVHFPVMVKADDVPLSEAKGAEFSVCVASASVATALRTEVAELGGKAAKPGEEAHVMSKPLNVDQAKIDRLMNLIGEMLVAKNALPYLAVRAETVFGVRELGREIKAQYAVINRIAEEMQGAIIEIRMTPVSSISQRFPRLVRDLSRKLGKDIALVLEGEETEADKNIIEALGDPLVHIVRNSLDHGFELPETRSAAGKPATGTLIIRASQQSDRMVIDIIDDGKGIDPEVIKRKAYEKGIIDEASLARLSNEDAINLVFAPGFSTLDVISDLSGRGVGMDVVRTAVERVNGTITLQSVAGQGTSIQLSLPLSIAISNVMIVESNGQAFGVPMDQVVETVRVRRDHIHTIKTAEAMVLRGVIVPLKSVNQLLGLSAPPLANEHHELAVLVVRVGEELVGLLVDDFRETMDIILKPMAGVLAGVSAYAGSALLGDGSVLMVLNVKELL